jgi:hypothetical protein
MRDYPVDLSAVPCSLSAAFPPGSWCRVLRAFVRLCDLPAGVRQALLDFDPALADRLNGDDGPKRRGDPQPPEQRS